MVLLLLNSCISSQKNPKENNSIQIYWPAVPDPIYDDGTNAIVYDSEMDKWIVDPYYLNELLEYIRLTQAARKAVEAAQHPP